MGKSFSRRHFEMFLIFQKKNKKKKNKKKKKKKQKNRICHSMQIGDNLHEMSNPVFFEKRKEKCHQSVVCWISPESG